jgi:hypothetical protein
LKKNHHSTSSIDLDAFRELQIDTLVKNCVPRDVSIFSVNLSNETFFLKDPTDPSILVDHVSDLYESIENSRELRTILGKKEELFFEQLPKFSFSPLLPTRRKTTILLGNLIKTLNQYDICLSWKMASRNLPLISSLDCLVGYLPSESLFSISLVTDLSTATRSLRTFTNIKRMRPLPFDYTEFDETVLCTLVSNYIQTKYRQELSWGIVSPPTSIQYFGDMLLYTTGNADVSSIKTELEDFLPPILKVGLPILPDTVREYFSFGPQPIIKGQQLDSGISVRDRGFEEKKVKNRFVLIGPGNYVTLLELLSEIGAHELHISYIELYSPVTSPISLICNC